MNHLRLAAGLALALCLLASPASAQSLTTLDLTPFWNEAISLAAIGLGTLAAWIGHRFVGAYAGDKAEGLWVQATEEAIAYARKQAQLYARGHSSIDLHNYLLKQGLSYFASVWPELWRQAGIADPEDYVRRVLEAAIGMDEPAPRPAGDSGLAIVTS